MPQMDNTSETITLRGPQAKLGVGKLMKYLERLLLSIMMKNLDLKLQNFHVSNVI